MKLASTLLLLLATCSISVAQSTSLKVYQIFQDKCAQCHSNAQPQAGLDLEGQGATLEAKALHVYNNLVNATPANATAAAKGDKYIYPGRADRSFLFRKINQGLEPLINLESGENQPMPPYGQPLLNDVEKELIRQWILFGSPLQDEVVEESVLEDYFSGNALQSFPEGAPEAPAPSEGFQIKMGPFYLAPGEEVEYFQKYELDLPEDQEITRVEIEMGTYSHHFIIYNFNPGGDAPIPAGLRLDADHSDISLVAAVQESTDLHLPQGTAFFWDNQLVLDLNSHYINYSASANYQAEAYINVYTQPQGTAAQEMYTELLVNGDIPIPNNGDIITHTQHINYNLGEIYVWGVMGHTHQYGTGYKVYERLPGGMQGDLIYDASCPQGTPGCVSPFFDYQHIPMRYFEPLRPTLMTPLYGLIHEASWVNDGPFPVNFGPTSDDEMMVMVIMYTEDITGVVDTEEAIIPEEGALVYPNPASNNIDFQLPGNAKASQVQLLDANGKIVLERNKLENTFSMDVSPLPSGLYFYRLTSMEGNLYTGKVVIR
ncbi:MAG: T9SS type A sorting domain-containing protein [Chitinophagales bacterium]|nr:T9SS type A sorting domain-containing protein [Chitinophagales bacterium]